jgi:DNA-binding response OmpR family regulator
MSREAICFVDDDPREVERFERYLGKYFRIGAGQSPAEARAKLGGRKPRLWVLDLYFPKGAPPAREQLERLHGARREFLDAEARFRNVLAGLGQGREGGLDMARDLQTRGQAGIAFFTRKGTLEDAIVAYEDIGAFAVIKKPDPNPEDRTGDAGDIDLNDAYDRALARSAELIAGRIRRAIRHSTWWGKHKTWLIGFTSGIGVSLAAVAVWALLF